MHVCQNMKKKEEHFKWKQAKYYINYHSDITLREFIPILYKTNNHSCLNMWHISTMRQSSTKSVTLPMEILNLPLANPTRELWLTWKNADNSQLGCSMNTSWPVVLQSKSCVGVPVGPSIMFYAELTESSLTWCSINQLICHACARKWCFRHGYFTEIL